MTVKDNDGYVPATIPILLSLGRAIERGVVFCAIAACLFSFSCTPFGGLITVIDVPQADVIENNEGIVWKGEALGHDHAEFLWGPPQKDWMYRNIINNSIYRHTGLAWVLWVNGILPVIKTNIMVDGDYIPQVGDYYPVLMVFTDGSTAGGYISNGATAAGDSVDADIGKVMLYDEYWNNGAAGKTYHTLTVLDISNNTDKVNENILLGRAFATDAVPPDDVVRLKLDAQRKLQPREERVSAPDDPLNPNGYIPIHTVEELMWINRDITSGTRDGKYLQMGDLDLLGNPPSNGITPTPEKHNWEPLGVATALNFLGAFKGTFDGNGYEIRNLYVNITDTLGAGLFRCVEGGTLRNITIASGSVTAQYNAGGIVGRAKDVTITGCVNNAGIATDTNTTTGPAGGIAGKIDGGSITNCGNTGSIISKNTGGQTGGIAGVLNGTVTISNCFNKGEIKGRGDNGGIAGYINGLSSVGISACYNTGAVLALTCNNIGGLVGHAQGAVNITASYNASEVRGSSSSWFIGTVDGAFADISNCYYLDLNDYHSQNAGELSHGDAVTANGNVQFDSANGWPTDGVTGWETTGDTANWKSLGNWIEGSAPDGPDVSEGFNSNFPTLAWEPEP